MAAKFRYDFWMRSQLGFWSEDVIRTALNATDRWYAIHYGATGMKSKEEFDLKAKAFSQVNTTKRPDLLVFVSDLRDQVDALVQQLPSDSLPYTDEKNHIVQKLLELASFAIECEGSNGNAENMISYNKKNQVPSIHLKSRDIDPLLLWQRETGIPIHICQLLIDRGYCIALDDAEQAINSGAIKSKTFMNETGDVVYYQIPYTHALVHNLGIITGAVPTARLHPQKNGQYTPYLTYDGGVLVMEASMDGRP